ncbi:FAD/NAD(P)-binding protein [Zunongwangia sp. HGR-M22]|uniref:FAD/NAD(P)-binding protein n=1 Tax=Zunongwangia sp. HGR-M22 TaxID=3015168 RepID=UPI0022DDA1F1|nr:FAD/NAD(P)-binding protein [Zunongwangia sp. HGR-M22]WBL26471.1 FAD/NAD(P)-binding protein [Zunongwangia sp. HGR-M22]
MAIIGMGPKGLYALERLLAQIKYNTIDQCIEVHIFNADENFGSGNVYAKNQPSYLIMNYASSNINAWIDETPKPIVQQPLSFIEWLKENKVDKRSNSYLDFAPRAIVGEYLNTVFKELVSNSPESISYYFHPNIVADIKKTGDKFQIKEQSDSNYLSDKIDNVLLTTGHLGAGADFISEQPASSFINFVYPTKTKLKDVKTGKVVIRGFGLTCIDTVLELTEGRAGIFKSGSSNKMKYLPSGKEPNCIYIISRSGLPMFPRNSSEEEIERLVYFTEENIEAALKLSFVDLFLPLIKKEFYFQYYKIAFKIKNLELKFDEDFETVTAQVTEFHSKFPEEEKYCWDQLIDPFHGQATIYNDQLIEYLKFLISEAKKGVHASPIMAAVGTWRKISPIFNKYYSFGRLDAKSHALFDRDYFGLFNRLSYGPPIINTEKLIALAEGGLIDFSRVRNAEIIHNKKNGYELILDKKSSSFRRNAENYDTGKIKIDTVIDARIPRGIDRRPKSLFSNLLTKGLLRSFKNKNNGYYEASAVDINKSGKAINANGTLEDNLSLYGTPTEGVTLDNDTLSRTRNNFASIWAQNVIQDIQNKNKQNLFNNTINVH